MTVTTSRPTSRFGWVPAAAGWIFGVIATLSLLSSVSPLVRQLIKVPREFINDYLFNFPDTSFAWAFVLAVYGRRARRPQAHRLVDAARQHGGWRRCGTSSTC